MTDQTQSASPTGATQPLAGTPALAAPAPGAVDPLAKQEQEFKDAIAKLHPVVEGAIAKVESEIAAVVAHAKPVALDTIEDVKAEAVLLGARFKTLADRLEDMAHNGVSNNPVFKQATNLVNHIVSIAKSL